MSRSLGSRSVPALVCAALVASVLLLAPAAEAKATARTITIAASPNAALGGTQVTFAGKLSKSPKGTSVKIQRKAGSKWVNAKATLTKTGAGAYSVKVALSAKAGVYKYRAFAPAFEGLKAAVSKVISVTSLHTTTFFKVGGNDVIYLHATDGDPSTATGRLNQASTQGASATLQRKDGSTWLKVGGATVGSNGLFQINFTALTGTYRVVIGRKGLNSSATSVAKVVTFDKA